MDIDEREAYRQFVRTCYRVLYHIPEYATAADYHRLMTPLLETAEALLGSEEIAVLQEREDADG